MNINQLNQAISRLDEEEAKKLLSLILTSDGRMEENISKVQNTLLQKGQAKGKQVHIITGDAAGGSLQAAFRNPPYDKTEEIIIIPDILSVGPLEGIHTEKGIKARATWFQQHYRSDFGFRNDYKERMLEAIEKIRKLPPYQDVVIWTCENASEQVGLRFVLYLLKDHLNNVFELNTFKAFHFYNTYPALEEEHFPLTSGEFTPENLLQFYEQYELRPLKSAKREALWKEGERLLFLEHLLRKWENNELWSSNTDGLDWLILECAERLQKEIGKDELLSVVRLIGEVMGQMEQYTGDGWIEFRIRELMAKGKFELHGELDSKRFYHVKFVEKK